MKMLKIAAPILCLAAVGAIAICILTDWNDGLFLPLALILSAVGNLLNFLCVRKQNGERKNIE